MNGNESIIIFLAIIGLPFCIWLLIVMPNASKCGSCGRPLSMHRQKTYHSVIGDKNVEICKTCYKCGVRFTPREIKLKQSSPINNFGGNNVISEISEKIKTDIKDSKPRQVSSVSVNGESNSINEVHEALHPSFQSEVKQQTCTVSTLGEYISISEVLEELKANNCVWLDTETTGLSSSDEIIEISICTHDKKVIFDSILSSKVTCSAQARAVHGITDAQIANGMPIESAKVILLNLLEGKTIISFNVDFDCKMLFQTIGLKTTKRFCVMKWSQSVLDYESWPSLEKVCERLNINQPKAHRAFTDTATTIDVFNKLVELTSNHKSLLRDFASIDLNTLERLEDGDTLFLSPNSDIFAFDWLIDRYGNDIIGIRSKALKRMLKKQGTRIFVKNTRKGKTLKVQYINEPDMQLPISIGELSNRLGMLKLKKTSPNKYLNLNATTSLSNINKNINVAIDGTYYFPSIIINPKIYESLDNLPIFQNKNRDCIAFTIKTPKSTLKRLFALGLQGYSSILRVIEHDEKISMTAYHLLDAQNITILSAWDVDGEKSWSGDY